MQPALLSSNWQFNFMVLQVTTKESDHLHGSCSSCVELRKLSIPSRKEHKLPMNSCMILLSDPVFISWIAMSILCTITCVKVPSSADAVYGLCSMQHGTIDILKPLGLSEDVCKNQLSPRSERAYSRINSEFDMLFQQLQPPDVKVSLLYIHMHTSQTQGPHCLSADC